LRRVIVIGIVALLVVVAALPAVAKVADVSKSGDRNDDRFAAQVEYFPTSKEQCKKGGWKNFTNAGFKNQGDCVSYVATGGKNPPSGAE
jgi:hypothetical protein